MCTVHKVLDNLYIGNDWAARREEMLSSIKATHIVVVGAELQKHFPAHFVYLQIEALDMPSFPLIQHFQSACGYIDAVLKEGGCVFVHCFQGISRSSTILSAYLMFKLDLPARKALSFLQQRHPQADPNFGFRYQLGQFEAVLSGEVPIPALHVGCEERVNCTCQLS
jgi:protein-tyrosine phosphatase